MLKVCVLIQTSFAEEFQATTLLNGEVQVSGTFTSTNVFDMSASPSHLDAVVDAETPSLTLSDFHATAGGLFVQLRKVVTVGLGQTKTLSADIRFSPTSVEVPSIGPGTLTPGLGGFFTVGSVTAAGQGRLAGTYKVSDGTETIIGAFDQMVVGTASLQGSLDSRKFPGSVVLATSDNWAVVGPLGLALNSVTLLSVNVGGTPVEVTVEPRFWASPAIKLVSGHESLPPAAAISQRKDRFFLDVTNLDEGSNAYQAVVKTRFKKLKRKGSRPDKPRRPEFRVKNYFNSPREVTGQNVTLISDVVPKGQNALLYTYARSHSFSGRYRQITTFSVSSRLYWSQPVTVVQSKVLRGSRR